MAEEIITILNIETGEAVQNIGELRDNIKTLKARLETLDIGSKEYQDTLSGLKVNQNALKDAMYNTSASMEDLAAAAKGTSETYNSLVHRMADLKTQLRNVDVSTESGKTRFKELANEVNGVNDKLKEMDALQGNYQRNVGNYTSALTGLSDILKSVPPTLGSTKEQLGKVGETIGLIGKQPLLAAIGLIAPVLMKISAGLKDNDTVLKSIDKAMEALQPILNFFKGILDKIGEAVSKVIDYFVEWANTSGETFRKIVSGAVGVGNAILQSLLTPIRSVIAAVKGLGSVFKDVFTGNFKKAKEDATAAIAEIGEAFKKGFSFKQNFQLGQEAGAQFAAGLMSRKPEVQKAADEVAKTVESSLQKVTSETIRAALDKELREKAAAAKYMEEQVKEIDDIVKADTAETLEFVNGVLAEIDEENARAQEEMEERARQRVVLLQGFTASVTDVLNSLADIYESDADANGKNAKRVKNLRIAAATIDTISGATAAYMGGVKSIPGPAGIALGIMQAATVTAAGLANIAKIRATNVDGGSSGAGAIQSAPSSMPVTPQQIETVTGASAETRLNQRPERAQRVYILSSDLEANRAATQARIQETSF